MNLYIKNGDEFIQVREINNGVQGSDLLIFRMNYVMRPADMREMENELSQKLNRPCVVLDARFDEIVGIKNG